MKIFCNMYKLLLCTLTILSIQYCSCADLEIRNVQNLIAQDLVEYVNNHAHEETDLKITFADTIQPAERAKILTASFAYLTDQNFTQQITYLDISSNELTEPPVLTNLTALVLLSLENNKLTEAPILTGLTALQVLVLADNLLTEPPVLTDLTSLQQLELSHNQLTRSPILTGLTALQKVYLSDNQLTEPPILTGLTELLVMDLSNNRLTEAPVLSGLTTLKLLKLDGNASLTAPLYIPVALKRKLNVEGYTNLIYEIPNKELKKQLLESSLTKEQIEAALAIVIELTNESQAKLIATAWLSQQDSEKDPHVTQSSTNIIFFAPHVFLTKEGEDLWKQFNQGELKSLPAQPDQPLLMRLPLHSMNALLTALYGDYDLNDLPVEDPVAKHIEFMVNHAEFSRLAQHFVKKYNLEPLTDAEINSCKKTFEATDIEQQYLLKELARIIRQKISPSSIQEFITKEEAIRIIREAIQEANLPALSDTAISRMLLPHTISEGRIKKASLKSYIQSYIRSRTRPEED